MSELDRIAKIQSEVNEELARARRIFPHWPSDIVHAVAIVNEEAGEMGQSANGAFWGHKGATLADVRKEAIQTMAMCWRLLLDTPCMTNGAAAHIGLAVSVPVVEYVDGEGA